MLRFAVRIRFLVLSLGFALMAANAPATMASAAEPPPQKQYLFTVEAARGVAVQGPRSATGELFVLAFAGLAPVTMFSDRPFRDAGLISPKALVANWDTWFASSPPNAVLTWSRAAGKPPASMVVVLGSPRFKNGVVVFRAARVSRLHDPVRHGSNWKRIALPEYMRGASLFIDSVTLDDDDEIDPEDEAWVEEDFDDDEFDDYADVLNEADAWALKP